MDKETLSNYGWIVICVLILAVMMALASPFGLFVSDAVKSTTQGLFDVNSSALNTVGISVTDTKTVYFENNWNWSNPKIYYWGSEMGSNPNWDGISLTETVGKTDAGYTVYKIEVPSDIDGMLFNGTGGYGFEQSEDVKDIKDGYAYYMTYTNNKKIAQSYLYEVAEEDETTSYTMEQIEADEHLYAIGKTKKEYVVAKFNDDYTEVVITKNGDDSDGLMCDFAIWSGNGKSPMTIHGNTLQTAIIKEGVASIGNGGAGYAPFGHCIKLTSISLPNSLTYIGNYAFEYCTSLVNAPKIPEGVTRLDGTFDGCSSLKNIPALPQNITYLGATFRSCTSLTVAPIIPDSVTDMSGAFRNCSSLKTISSIPSSVTNMCQTFANCTSLTEAPVIPNSVTNMEGTFEECSSLIFVPTISNNTTTLARTFLGCGLLTSVPDIPASVIDMERTFASCTSLTSVSAIPNGVTNMIYTFMSCTSLTGTVEINATPDVYDGCFNDTVKSINITGESNILNELAETGPNVVVK